MIYKIDDGKLELIDEQVTKSPAFSIKSLTAKRSEKLNKDEALIWIKKQLAKGIGIIFIVYNMFGYE